MLDQLYTDIRDRLIQKLFAEYVPTYEANAIYVLQQVALYSGQLDDLRSGQPHRQGLIGMPAIFVELSEVEWRERNGGMQLGDVTVRLHVYQETKADEDWKLGEYMPDAGKALLPLRYLGHVNDAMHGAAWEYSYSTLKRRTTITDVAHNNVAIHVIEYACTICDQPLGTKVAYEEATPSFTITPQIKTNAR